MQINYAIECSRFIGGTKHWQSVVRKLDSGISFMLWQRGFRLILSLYFRCVLLFTYREICAKSSCLPRGKLHWFFKMITPFKCFAYLDLILCNGNRNIDIQMIWVTWNTRGKHGCSYYRFITEKCNQCCLLTIYLFSFIPNIFFL